MHKHLGKILIIFFLATLLKAQDSVSTYYPYSNFITLTLGTGLTKGETDYPNSDIGFLGKGTVEYFIKSKTKFSVGLHLDGGFSQINGSGIKSGAPKDFESQLFALGLGASLNYKLKNNLVPFIGLEMQSIWIDVNQYSNPQNPNIKLITDKSAINFLTEVGLRYVISELISLNGSVGFNFVNADHIDGLNILNTKSDYFTTFNLSLSYAIDLSEQNDKDNDGISDSDDNCPYQAEDFDGFEDEDGCPEFDNDGDGIIDSKDKCPNEAEDFDGFEDKDGCPEFDNDGDGILDVNDKCPDEKEDFDGFQDEDGCPDLDNDNDGILDINDKCPNEAETFNNFEDGDGCPDTIPKATIIEEPKDEQPKIEKQETEQKIEPQKNSNKILVPSEFLLEGKSTFDSGSPKIKSSAFNALNQIAEQIKSNPGLKWRIEGHMDNSGTPFEVKALSTARANAVLEYMVSKGIPPTTFDAVGLGDQFPASSNSTAFGREKNRRVIIKRMR
ncbi:MAG: OmpA family protein [Ignavibacteriae bacterium]|nr:OmpA family protein [Ignavibacteriota bacterium]